MNKRTSVNEAEIIIRRLRSEGWLDHEIRAVAHSITRKIPPTITYVDLGDRVEPVTTIQMKSR
jgi:hypothetical protein